MSVAEADVAPSTIITAPFYGANRNFQLRIGEIGELERLCRAGIGRIMVRLQIHEWFAADVWETIRLGLIGGGMTEVESTAIVMAVQREPIASYLGLASDIIVACINGVKPSPKAPGESGAAATSPPSTPPVPSSASTPEPSTGSPSPSSTRRSRATTGRTAASKTKRRRPKTT